MLFRFPHLHAGRYVLTTDDCRVPVVFDPAEFRKVVVDPELGTIVWPNAADICPDVLHHGRSPASLEESSK